MTLYQTRNHTWYDARLIITHKNIIINIIVFFASGYSYSFLVTCSDLRKLFLHRIKGYFDRCQKFLMSNSCLNICKETNVPITLYVYSFISFYFYILFGGKKRGEELYLELICLSLQPGTETP